MKSIRIIGICLCLIFMLSQSIYAVGDIFGQGENWINTGLGVANNGQTMNTDALKSATDSLYGFLLAIATVIAVIVGAIMGIQFMTAGIDKRVQVKESLFPYMVSCLVIFGALGIWRLVIYIMREI